MKTILILWMFVGGPPVAITAEFDNPRACEVAAQMVIEKQKSGVTYVCAPKSGGKADAKTSAMSEG
jgi:hypothetical protein